MKALPLVILGLLAIPSAVLAISDGMSMVTRANYNQADNTLVRHSGPGVDLIFGAPGTADLVTTLQGNTWSQALSVNGVQYASTEIVRNGNMITRTFTLLQPDGSSCTIRDVLTEIMVLTTVPTFVQGTTYAQSMTATGTSEETCFGESSSYNLSQDISMSETVVGTLPFASETYSNQDCILVQQSSQSDLVANFPGLGDVPLPGDAATSFVTLCAGVGPAKIGALKLVSVEPLAAATSDAASSSSSHNPLLAIPRAFAHGHRP